MKAFKDSHHMVARLFAMGLRPGEVAEQSGYSLSRISILRGDPSFGELIEHYRKVENAAFTERRDVYWDNATAVRNRSARMMLDQLDEADETGEALPLTTLLRMHDSFADRTGYGKRSTQVNINVDFAAKLDQALKTSRQIKTIEGELAEDRKPRVA